MLRVKLFVYQTHVLKLCDFGSAKILVREELNVSYICSRYVCANRGIVWTRFKRQIFARRTNDTPAFRSNLEWLHSG